MPPAAHISFKRMAPAVFLLLTSLAGIICCHWASDPTDRRKWHTKRFAKPHKPEAGV